MHAPVVTTAAAGLLGLIFIALSARVVMGRTSTKTLFGSGNSEADPLFVAIRSHANFAEFVPLCLLLLGGLEIQNGPTVLVKGLAAILVLARLAHPVGMAMKNANAFRAAGFAGTVLVLAVASVSAVLSLIR